MVYTEVYLEGYIKDYMDSEKTHRSTKLYQAIAENDLGKLKSIIRDSKIDLNKIDYYGDTPLLFASEIGRLDMVRYLVEEAKVELLNKRCNQYPIHRAAEYNRLDIVRYLIEQCQADCDITKTWKETPIYNAARYGHLDVVRYLFEEAKADPEKTNSGGWAPIHAAARYGHLDVVRYLVKVASVNFNKLDNPCLLGRTPRYLAKNNGKEEVADYLNSIGAV